MPGLEGTAEVGQNESMAGIFFLPSEEENHEMAMPAHSSSKENVAAPGRTSE